MTAQGSYNVIISSENPATSAQTSETAATEVHFLPIVEALSSLIPTENVKFALRIVQTGA